MLMCMRHEYCLLFTQTKTYAHVIFLNVHFSFMPGYVTMLICWIWYIYFSGNIKNHMASYGVRPSSRHKYACVHANKDGFLNVIFMQILIFSCCNSRWDYGRIWDQSVKWQNIVSCKQTCENTQMNVLCCIQ